MPTAYNFLTTEYKSKQANRGVLEGPQSNDVIYLKQTNQGIVELASAGAFTLEPAAGVPVDVEVLVLAQASVSVNTVALVDGQFSRFRVVKNSSGANVWVVVEGVGALAYTGTPIALGTVDIEITDAPTEAAILALLNGLKAQGIVTGTFS